MTNSRERLQTTSRISSNFQDHLCSSEDKRFYLCVPAIDETLDLREVSSWARELKQKHNNANMNVTKSSVRSCTQTYFPRAPEYFDDLKIVKRDEKKTRERIFIVAFVHAQNHLHWILQEWFVTGNVGVGGVFPVDVLSNRCSWLTTPF